MNENLNNVPKEFSEQIKNGQNLMSGDNRDFGGMISKYPQIAKILRKEIHGEEGGYWRMFCN